MLLVLDTNIYIFAFTPPVKQQSCQSLIRLLASSPLEHQLRIPRTIAEEVRRNLVQSEFREFFEFISEFTIIDEDFFIPFELGARYERKGLKEADAFIAAYTEWVGADVLVTENRHFLNHQHDLPFKILTAEKCLSLISSI